MSKLKDYEAAIKSRSHYKRFKAYFLQFLIYIDIPCEFLNRSSDTANSPNFKCFRKVLLISIKFIFRSLYSSSEDYKIMYLKVFSNFCVIAFSFFMMFHSKIEGMKWGWKLRAIRRALKLNSWRKNFNHKFLNDNNFLRKKLFLPVGRILLRNL